MSDGVSMLNNSGMSDIQQQQAHLLPHPHTNTLLQQQQEHHQEQQHHHIDQGRVIL